MLEKLIESDSESDSGFVIHNYDETGHKIDENKIVIPEAMRQLYGTDNYEWNHYKLRKGEICDFSRDRSFLQNFLHSIYISSGGNVSVNLFLPMSKNYVGEKENHYDIVDDPLANKDDSKIFEESKDCFYLNILYAMRDAVSGEYSHNRRF